MITRHLSINQAEACVWQFVANLQNSFIFAEHVLDVLDFQSKLPQSDPQYERAENFLKQLCLESPLRRSLGLFN